MQFVRFDGATYQLREGESVLEGLIRGGAQVSFSCRKGTCQTCMLRAVEGTPGQDATRGLRTELVETGHFLPCRCHPTENLTLEKPRLSDLFVKAVVAQKDVMSPSVVRLLLETERNLAWTAGQYLNLRTDDGEVRSYSIASIAEQDYFIEIHVKRREPGKVSGWIHDALEAGDELQVQGPLGDCVYRPEFQGRDLVMLGTGTGLAPLIGVARDALLQGHQGKITLYHGVATQADLYMHDTLQALTAAHENFAYVPCVSDGEVSAGMYPGLVTTAAFEAHPELGEHVLYLCGHPEMVFDARYQAILAGAKRKRIVADPFDSGYPIWPRDTEKLIATQSDPEMWEAMEGGPRLRRLLEGFYDELYEDPILNPFFHNATKERAVSKQYNFLAEIFTGKKIYFGLKPFNAHHWMVISDEVFDYREEMFERHLRADNLEEHLIRRWCAFQELFRRELVKPSERGLIIHGKEKLLEGFSNETVEIATLCDGCFQEMPVGSSGRMHRRTGQLYCTYCGPRKMMEVES